MSVTKTKQQSDDEPAYSFEATVSADVLDDYLERIEAVGAEECKIHIDDDGFWTRAVGPSNVCMADVSLGSVAFESYSGGNDDAVIGLSTERLREMIGVGSGSDLVHIGLDAETRMLDVSLPGAGVAFDLALIDPDSIRQEPDIPEIDFPVEVVFEAEWLQRGAKVADMVGDHVTFATDADADPNFAMSGEGDIDTGTTRIDEEDLVGGTAAGDAESIYSIDYLKALVKVFDTDDELTVELGTELPTKIHFEFADGSGEGTFMIAPRIQQR